MILFKYGVTFGELHSWRDLHLAMEERQEIGAPEPDLLRYVVPGRNGTLDISESRSGRVTFKSRPMTFKFVLREKAANWAYRFSELQRILHGKQMRIICDDDPYYFYFGRVAVDKVRSSKYTGRITVTAEVDPYKYEKYSSLEDWLWDPFDFRCDIIREYGRLTSAGALDAEHSIAIDGSKALSIPGTPMPVIPTFYAKSSDGNGITVTFKGTAYPLYLTDAEHTVAGHNVIEGVTSQAYVAEGMDYDHTTGAIRITAIEIDDLMRVGDTVIDGASQVLNFSGHGAVAVDYRGGRL